MKKIIFLCVVSLCCQSQTMAQKTLPLYDQVPNSIQSKNYVEHIDHGDDGVDRISKVTTPTLTVFRPSADKNAHAAVVICPGGGYSILAFNSEGTEVAKLLSSWGITALVLKYRLPSDQIMPDKSIGPLQDAQRAIQLVRLHSEQWDIDKNKVGIMGFSAGGHLAATASTHFEKAVIDNPDKISLRPDFSILAYPVISMKKGLTHMGSRENLLGRQPSATLIQSFSNEQQVTDSTPPAFLMQAGDDQAVPPENSLDYYGALLGHHIPAELHLYQNGGHGFGLHNHSTTDKWANRLKHWLQHNHIIPAGQQ